MWGQFVVSELESIEGKSETDTQGQRERKLNSLLGLGERPGQFADPAILFEK